MQATTITCKACGNHFEGKYCNRCGEKVYTDHDRRLAHLFEEGFHFVTHFEGTFFTTLKYIFTRPGKLSEDYCYGKRKTLFKPMSLFFLLVVIYLLFPVFEGLNMKLYYHVRHNVYGGYARNQIIHLMRQHNWSDAQVSEIFQEKAAKVSRFMLLVLLPLTALFFWALTFKKRKYFFDQMVFATEINSVYLIWGFLIMPLLVTVTQILSKFITGSYLPFRDGLLGVLIYFLLVLYVAIAVRRFYNLKWWPSVGVAFGFYIAHVAIVQVIYKFLLFYTTVKLLH